MSNNYVSTLCLSNVTLYVKVTMSVTFVISGSSEARAMIFFLFSRSRMHTVTIKCDPVRQGHVTLGVTFVISGSSDTRAMIFLFHSFFWGKDLK